MANSEKSPRPTSTPDSLKEADLSLRWKKIDRSRLQRRRGLVFLLAGLALSWGPWLLEGSAKESVALLQLRRTVKTGHRLLSGDLRVVHEARYHPLQIAAGQLGLVLGRELRNPLRAGLPLLWNDLSAPESALHPLAARLGKDQQAVEISLAQRDSSASNLAPGDQVELWWRGAGRLQLLASHLSLLALNGRFSVEPGQLRVQTATFAVPVSAVSQLLALQQKGEFMLTVISLQDHGAASWHIESRRAKKEHIRRRKMPEQPRLFTGQ